VAFHELSFPVNPTVGSDGGPGFDTAVMVMDSGQERRIQRRTQAQHWFNAAFHIRSLADISLIRDHYLRVSGVSDGFRYSDSGDMDSTTLGRTWGDDSPPAITNIDQVLTPSGDGSLTTFQLIKTYGSGTATYVRTIKKPVAGTTVVAIDGVNQASGWTIDTTTGVITFSVAPAIGEVVSAGYQFDVPVRFGEQVDQVLRTVIESFGHGSVPAIPMIELMDESPANEAMFVGGSNDTLAAVTADFTLNQGEGLVWPIDVSTSGRKATLPAFVNLGLGGPHFVLINLNGSNSLAVHDVETDTLQFTLAASSQLTIWLAKDSGGNRQWYAA